jgi:hypothetical protein
MLQSASKFIIKGIQRYSTEVIKVNQSVKSELRLLIMHKMWAFVPTNAHDQAEVNNILDLGTRWGEWSASHPSYALLPWERTPSTHWIGGWM